MKRYVKSAIHRTSNYTVQATPRETMKYASSKMTEQDIDRFMSDVLNPILEKQLPGVDFNYWTQEDGWSYIEIVPEGVYEGKSIIQSLFPYNLQELPDAMLGVSHAEQVAWSLRKALVNRQGRYRNPNGEVNDGETTNWTKALRPRSHHDRSLTVLENYFGLTVKDFKASNMAGLLAVADKLGVSYSVEGTDVVLEDFESEVTSLFIDLLCRKNRCVTWEKRDWDFDNKTLTVHFFRP